MQRRRRQPEPEPDDDAGDDDSGADDGADDELAAVVHRGQVGPVRRRRLHGVHDVRGRVDVQRQQRVLPPVRVSMSAGRGRAPWMRGGTCHG